MLFDWIVANSGTCVYCVGLVAVGIGASLAGHAFINSAFRITERIELQKDMLEYLKLIAKKEQRKESCYGEK